MLNTRINNIIDSLKLPKQDRTELNRLLSRPEVQEVLKADEREQIAHRKALIGALMEIPAQIDKAKLAAGKKHEDNIKRFEAAELEYKAAMVEVTKSLSLETNAGYQLSLKSMYIERELTACSDPRINDYRFELGNIIGRVRTKVEYWTGKIPKNWVGIGGDKVNFSNVDDVAEARTALDDALVILRSLELSAITTAETTQALNDLTHTLKSPLEKLQMHPPTLDENNKVIPPKRDGERALIKEVA